MKRILSTIFITVWILLLCGVGYSADLSRGQNFTDGNRLFASELHALVDSATILAGFYTDKTAQSTLDSDDVFLVYSQDLSAYRKITAQNALYANTALITGQTEDAAPATNDFLLAYDTSAMSLKKWSLHSLSNTVFIGTSNALISSGSLSNNLVLPAVTNAALIGAMRTLIATNRSGSENSQVGLQAEELILKNSVGFPYLAKSAAVTIDITASGANGLDTGAEANSTWYHIWIIYNGTTVAGLFSTSDSSPTMPSGYTYKARVGAVYNQSTGNFRRFLQIDRDVSVDDTLLFTGLDSTSASTLQTISGTAGKSVELSTIIPPTSRKVKGYVGTATSASRYSVTVSSDSSNVGALKLMGAPTGSASDTFAGAMMFELLLATQQDFYWRTDSGEQVRMFISGFSL